MAPLHNPPSEAAANGGGLTPALREAIAARVRRHMAARGMNEAALAAAANVALSTVYLVTGAKAGWSLNLLAKFSGPLHVPLDAFFTDAPSFRPGEATTVLIKGSAARGVWRTMATKDEPRGAAADVVPKDPRYQKFPRYGIAIDDDSLMGLHPPVPRGSVAIYADLSGSDLAIEAGIYLVHQVRGDDVRSFFARVDAYRDRYEIAVLGAAPPEVETIPREEFERGTSTIIGGRLVATCVEKTGPDGLPAVMTKWHL